MSAIFKYLLPACLALLLPGLAGAAGDPWRPANEVVHQGNSLLDRYLLRPVALSYKRCVPGFARRGVGNFFSNLDDIRVLANDLLQLKGREALRDSGRLLLNSTAGVGGVVDVASRFGLYKRQEDFGQTLGYWGVPSGPYLVLPLFGPSTLRDAVGQVPDLLLNPVAWLDPPATRQAVYGLSLVDTRTSLLAGEALVGDDYLLLREAWLQRRDYLVSDGEIDDDYDDFDADW